MIIIHDQGYAILSPTDFPNGGNVTLQPWGIVKGKLMIGSQPGANEQVTVHNQVIHYTESGRNSDFSPLTWLLPPTPMEISLSKKSRPAPAPSTTQKVRATELFLRQHHGHRQFRSRHSGHPRRHGPDDCWQSHLAGRSVDWSTIPVRIHTKVADAPTTRPKREDFSTFEAFVTASDNYFHSYQKQKKRFQTQCSSDGSFQVLNVPPGTYELNFQIRDTGKNSAVPRSPIDRPPVLDSLTREFVISDDKSTDPIDLGTLELTPPQASVSAR